ncbi:hypothetical protein HN011_005117 [Eciton burchellii]|nr:hypothetical protein HN011_005117 [Eciton burchellii]
MSARYANDLTEIELKEELRKLSNNQKFKRLKIRKRLLAREASMNDQSAIKRERPLKYDCITTSRKFKTYVYLRWNWEWNDKTKNRVIGDSASCTNRVPNARASTGIGLNAEHTRILIALPLRGKALAWLHSKTEHMELSMEDLFGGLKLCSIIDPIG